MQHPTLDVEIDGGPHRRCAQGPRTFPRSRWIPLVRRQPWLGFVVKLDLQQLAQIVRPARRCRRQTSGRYQAQRVRPRPGLRCAVPSSCSTSRPLPRMIPRLKILRARPGAYPRSVARAELRQRPQAPNRPWTWSSTTAPPRAEDQPGPRTRTQSLPLCGYREQETLSGTVESTYPL